jgi:chromosome segregation ATPase
MLKESKAVSSEAEKKYEDVARKLQMCEGELERAEERADTAEAKLKHLDTELHIVTTTLKSLEISETKASQKEDSYEGTIRDLTNRLKEAETHANDTERNAQKMQKDVDRLEEELQQARKQNKQLRDEVDAAFQEIQNI